MKSSIQKITVVVALSLSALVSFATEEPNTSPPPPTEAETLQRKHRVAEEIAKRRAEREAVMAESGAKSFRDVRDGVVYPAGKGGDPEEKVKCVVHNLPVGLVAAAYAKLSGREVMVSSGVSMIPMSLNCDEVPRRVALNEIEKAWTALGVRVVELGGPTIALVKEAP